MKEVNSNVSQESLWLARSLKNICRRNLTTFSLHQQPFIRWITSTNMKLKSHVFAQFELSVDLDCPIDLADERVGSIESDRASQQPECGDHDHLRSCEAT